MKKAEYDKKERTGWIADQYSLEGSYINAPEFGNDYNIFLSENNVSIFISKKQLRILKKLIEEFDKFHKI